MDLQTQTSNILGSISDTAESICSDKVLFPKETAPPFSLYKKAEHEGRRFRPFLC